MTETEISQPINNTTGRGGRREGAGRPPKHEEKKIQRSIHFRPKMLSILKQASTDKNIPLSALVCNLLDRPVKRL